jgi:glutamyl-tRNA reductase
MRDRAEEVRVAELQRQRSRLDGMDPAAQEAVDAITKAMVAKLLHDPTVRLKDAAGTVRGERLADSLRDLFDL